MSLLDHPDARALLADAVLTPDAVRGCQDRLAAFLQRYLPCLYRAEQRASATPVIRGLLGGLRRKTCEPIAVAAGVHRKPVPSLVGAGTWDDEAVRAALRRHAREELADDGAVIVIDATTFPRSGGDSCGVARPWCGRLGKQENCRTGVFRAHAAPGGYAPLDRRLYLPEDWALDAGRREECHVPEDVVSLAKWRIAADLLRRSREGSPHGWVVGDDEFGRPARSRARLRGEKERYGLDVPSDTVVRDPECRRPPRRHAGRGARRQVPYRRVEARAARQPGARWTRLKVRDGERGPPGRRHDGAGPDEAGPPQRAGGAAGGDAHGRGRARGPRRAPQRRARGPAGGPGPRAVHEAQGRGGLRGGQAGGGAGAPRGAQLGGLAPPRDAGAAGLGVPVPRAASSRGGRPRR